VRPPIRKEEVHDYLRDCFARESPPRVSELAERIQTSRVTLNRQMKRLFGVSASAYLKAEQLGQAKKLLRRTNLSTTRVAYAGAFGTRRTFYRAFRRNCQVSPAEFRRNQRRRDQSERLHRAHG
jgi:AraC-like DNA-binding protein